jgi:hypothetical protein
LKSTTVGAASRTWRAKEIIMKTVRRITPIACALAWALIGPAAKPAAAHPNSDPPPNTIQAPGGHDRPGAPPIITTVTLSWIGYPYELWSQDAGSYAEMVVTTATQHEGHGYDSWPFKNDYIRWPVDFGTWATDRVVYSHLECSPMNTLHLSLWGFEADASSLSEAEAKLLKDVVDLTVSDKYLIGRSIVLKMLKRLFAWLNPDDDLGWGSVDAEFPNVYTIRTTDGDYSIDGHYAVTTEVQNTDDCDPNTPIPPSNQPEFGFSLSRIDSLERVFSSADSIQPEPGQSYLTPQDIQDTRTAVRSMTVGMARWLSLRMLEQAQPHYGFSSALYYFNQAESESGTAAFTDYRYATFLAEDALTHNGIDPNAAPMTPVIVGLPTFMATRSGRSVEYLIGAFGTNAHGVSIATVTGGPPGAFYSIQNPDPECPWLQVLRVNQNAAPGTYTIHITFTGGLGAASLSAAVAPLTLTLDLAAPPPVTGVKLGRRPLPDGFALAEVRPNPVTTAAVARVDLPVDASFSLALYDVAGHRVRSIADDQSHGAGTVLFRLDAQGLAAGVYYLRVVARPTAGGAPFRAVRSVVVTR